MQYSVSQAGNIAVIAGLLAMFAAKLGYTFITTDQIQIVLGAVVSVVGVAVNWYDQVKQGHSTPAGFRVG